MAEVKGLRSKVKGWRITLEGLSAFQRCFVNRRKIKFIYFFFEL